MNLVWLHSFRRVAETHSYSRAADSLFITQPAVSQHVRRLEQYFGFKLLTQVGREVQLTDAGRTVYQLACTVEQEITSVRERLDDIESRAHGLVTIASPPTPRTQMIPPLLRQFWSIYPGVSVRTLSRGGKGLTDAVLSGVADIGFQTAPFLHPSLVIALQIRDRLAAVCAPGHVLAGRAAVPAAEIQRLKVAQLLPPADSRTLVDQWFADRGVRLENRLELSSLDEIRAAALEELAIGFLSWSRVRDDVAAERLVRLNLEGFDLVRHLYVIHRPDIEPPASDMVALIVQLLGHLRAPAERPSLIER